MEHSWKLLLGTTYLCFLSHHLSGTFLLILLKKHDHILCWCKLSSTLSWHLHFSLHTLQFLFDFFLSSSPMLFLPCMTSPAAVKPRAKLSTSLISNSYKLNVWWKLVTTSIAQRKRPPGSLNSASSCISCFASPGPTGCVLRTMGHKTTNLY